MHKMFRTIGLVLLAGGVLVGIAAFFIVNSQEFVLALLARVVERPFEVRALLAVLVAAGFAVAGALLGLLYLGMARLLEDASPGR